jgi:hypothetical protein
MAIGHLLLHWRKKNVETPVGFVADFCPICRDIRSFRLMRMGIAMSFVEIPLGQGKEVGHYIECTECKVPFWAEEQKYSFVAEANQPDIDLLVETTNLPLRFAYANRLELEGELRKRTARLSRDIRTSLLMEPLIALSLMVEKRFADSGRIDAQSSFGCLGTVVVVAGALFYSTRLRGPAQDRALVVMGILLAIGVGYNLLQLHDAPGRFVKTEVARTAARALKPLGPSRTELEDCLKKCRQMDLRIGKVLKPEWLWAKLRG